jgi:predicted amidohydrolase
VIDAEGDITASYDKIHLFDVDLPDGESWRESATYTGGERAVLAETPWGLLGLTICYDVRFPALYRRSPRAALVPVRPACFTKQTGEAHWHVLHRPAPSRPAPS